MSKKFDAPDPKEVADEIKKFHLKEFGKIKAEFIFDSLISFLAEEEFSSFAEYKKNNDGSSKLELENATPTAIWKILSDYGELVKLTNPEDLKRKFRKDIKIIIKKYEKDH